MLKPRSRPTKGLSLPSVLLLTAVAVTAAFALAAVTTTQLNFATRYRNSQDALYLAEAALAEAIGRIHNDPNYGKQRETLLLPEANLSPDRSAILSFDPDRSGQVPVSTNDLTENGSGGTAHLVARANVRGVVRTVEVLVAIPPFEYAVATAGSVESTNGMTVMGLQGPTSPGNIASNVSIEARGPCDITGDAVANGTVDVPAGSVRGRLLPGAPIVDLPDLDPEADLQLTPQNPALRDLAVLQEQSNHFGDMGVQGVLYTSKSENDGDLTVHGNLNLDKGLLYVEGDLRVEGRVTGRGAVVVKGSTTVEGSASVGADGSQVALLSEGDVRIQGDRPPEPGQQSNFFEGLVYTRGDFTASQVQVAGAFVAAPPKGSKTQVAPEQRMTMDQAAVKYNPDAARFTVVVDTPGVITGDIVAFGQGAGPLMDPAQIAKISPYAQSILPTVQDRLNRVIDRFTSGKPYECRNYAPGRTVNVMSLKLDHWTERLTEDMNGDITDILRAAREGRLDPNAPLELCVYVKGSDGDHLITEAGGNGRFVMRNLPLEEKCMIEFQCGLPPDKATFPGWNRGWIGLDKNTVNKIGEAYGVSNLYEDMTQTSVGLQRAFTDEANNILDDYAALRASTTGGGHYEIPVDLNQFLQDTRPLRVLMWRER